MTENPEIFELYNLKARVMNNDFGNVFEKQNAINYLRIRGIDI